MKKVSIIASLSIINYLLPTRDFHSQLVQKISERSAKLGHPDFPAFPETREMKVRDSGFSKFLGKLVKPDFIRNGISL